MSKYPREKLFSPSVNAGSVFPRATLSPTHDPDDGGPGIKNCKTFLPSKMSSEVMSQCDHIWRNFTTLKNVQSRDNFWAFVHCLAKCWSHFGKKIMLLGELSLWMVKYLKYNLVIWSHWSWHKIWAFVTFRARCLRSKLCCYLLCHRLQQKMFYNICPWAFPCLSTSKEVHQSPPYMHPWLRIELASNKSKLDLFWRDNEDT